MLKKYRIGKAPLTQIKNLIALNIHYSISIDIYRFFILLILLLICFFEFWIIELSSDSLILIKNILNLKVKCNRFHPGLSAKVISPRAIIRKQHL
jgi:hypothetical protein